MCDTKNRVYLWRVDTVSKRVLWVGMPCKLWKCKECGEMNKKQWMHRIAYGIQTYKDTLGGDWFFQTLTSHEKNQTFEKSSRVFKSAWPKLYARVKRVHPNLKYVILPEMHKTKSLHWHMISNAPLTTRWLKDNGREVGLGYKNESEPCKDPTMAAVYVSKYVTKSLLVGDLWPDDLRRVRTSVKWPVFDHKGVSNDFSGYEAIGYSGAVKATAILRRDGYSFVNAFTGEISVDILKNS